MDKRTTLADALHQAGRRTEAEARFVEAEAMQAELQPEYPILYFGSTAQYCDLLLAEAERAAWRLQFVGPEAPLLYTNPADERGGTRSPFATTRPTIRRLIRPAEGVAERAQKNLAWDERTQNSLLDIGLDHLTLARARCFIKRSSAASRLPAHM